MKSFTEIQQLPAGKMLVSDDILELHALRVILMISICGNVDKIQKKPRIEGLTKFAKTDFFIRYPKFMKIAAKNMQKEINVPDDSTESSMIRFHYGPWDQRYYQLISYLISRDLLKVEKNVSPQRYEFTITDKGVAIALEASNYPEFYDWILRMNAAKSLFHNVSGTKMKNMIYGLFEEEVKDLQLGELIR